MTKKILYFSAVGLSLLAFLFLLSINQIGHHVKQRCLLAQEKYDGDCVEALISYLDDEENGFGPRNSAVWALGQLGDERALPVLKKYYLADVEDGRWNETLAQSEIKRAISYMEGKTNITPFFWDFGRK